MVGLQKKCEGFEVEVGSEWLYGGRPCDVSSGGGRGYEGRGRGKGMEGYELE